MADLWLFPPPRHLPDLLRFLLLSSLIFFFSFSLRTWSFLFSRATPIKDVKTETPQRPRPSSIPRPGSPQRETWSSALSSRRPDHLFLFPLDRLPSGGVRLVPSSYIKESLSFFRTFPFLHENRSGNFPLPRSSPLPPWEKTHKSKSPPLLPLPPPAAPFSPPSEFVFKPKRRPLPFRELIFFPRSRSRLPSGAP